MPAGPASGYVGGLPQNGTSGLPNRWGKPRGAAGDSYVCGRGLSAGGGSPWPELLDTVPGVGREFTILREVLPVKAPEGDAHGNAAGRKPASAEKPYK